MPVTLLRAPPGDDAARPERLPHLARIGGRTAKLPGSIPAA